MKSLLEYLYLTLVVSIPVAVSTAITTWGKIKLYKLERDHTYKMFEMYKPLSDERVRIISNALKSTNKGDSKDKDDGKGDGIPKLSDKWVSKTG